MNTKKFKQHSMVDKSWNNDKKDREKKLEELYEDLSGDDFESEVILDEISENNADSPEISESETEEALKAVNQRLGFQKQKKTPADSDQNNTARSLFLKRKNVTTFLAAAAILLVLGTGWYIIPVTIQIPYGETVTLTLPDGSTTTLNSGTEIRYNRLFNTTNRNLSLNGEAYFQVESSGQPFTVSANGTVTEVAGTQFNVRSWKNDPGAETTITVAEGEVYFYPETAAGERVLLTEGLSSFWFTGMLQPSSPDPVELQNALAWKNRNLAFTGQPLSVIFNELERKFDTTISISEARIGRETLTTFYSSPENLEILLDDICTVKGLNYAETANGYRIFRE